MTRNWLLRAIRLDMCNLIGSDAIILSAITLHLFEGWVLLTYPANQLQTIGLAALMLVFRSAQTAASFCIISATLAVIGQYMPGLPFSARILSLGGQASLLVITSAAATIAVISEHYADNVSREWVFIACDQYMRIVAAPLYFVAIIARMRYEL